MDLVMPDAAPRPRLPGRPRDAAIDEVVLRAAFELFLERGAEGATIDDIAKRTGVARATIYRRWKSREDLLVAALRTLKRPAAGDPDAIAQMPLEDLIRHIQEVLVESLLRPEVPTLVARLIGAQFAYPQLVRSYREQFVEPAWRAVLGVIMKGRESGSLRGAPDPELLRDLLTGALIHRIVMRTDAPEEKKEREWVEALMSHLGLVTRRG
jgi:AcrR family transcriptional regulator